MARYNKLGDPSDHFQSAVAAGEVKNVTPLFRAGLNPAVAGDEEPIWSGGMDLVFPTEATTMTVSSEGANDTVAGTGAQVVYIEGLDANYNVITETAALNGTTPVTLTNQYLRINYFFVVQAGSGATNEDILHVGYGTVTAGVPATPMRCVPAGFSRDCNTWYTVPAGHKLIINKLIVGTSKDKMINIRVRRRIGGVETIELEVQVDNGYVELESDYLVVVPATVDIWVTGQRSSGSGSSDIKTISLGTLRKIS